jgi:hypothetical protein
MPLFQVMTERANWVFNRHNIANVALNVLESKSFSEIAAKLEIAHTAGEREFLDSFPPSIQGALRAVLQSALNRSPRLPVTFAWAPGYDFELLISEARTHKGSLGGITLFVRTRYPGD